MINTKTSFLVLILLLSLIATLFALTPVDAAVTTTTPTLRFRRPKVIGVGQSMLLTAWTSDIVPDIGETAGTVPSPNGRAGWYGMQINLTKPNGESVLLDLPHSDPVAPTLSNTYLRTVGTYTIQSIFPATWKNTTLITSPLHCCSQPHRHLHCSKRTNSVLGRDTSATSYWTRPLNTANRYWYVLGGTGLLVPPVEVVQA